MNSLSMEFWPPLTTRTADLTLKCAGLLISTHWCIKYISPNTNLTQGICRKSWGYLTLNISSIFYYPASATYSTEPEAAFALGLLANPLCPLVFPTMPMSLHQFSSYILSAMPADWQYPCQPHQLRPLPPSPTARNAAPVSLLACSPCFISPGVSELWSLQEGFSNPSRATGLSGGREVKH